MAGKLWSNVAVAMQSAITTAQSITGVTKANPAVVTYAGADTFANGDYIYITATGMTQINERVFRVANVNTAANTLELEGIDSSAYDTFVSGTIQLITFGTTISSLVDLSATGGEPEQKDQTTIHDSVRKQYPGVFSAIVYNFQALWDPSDSGLVAMKAASDIKAIRAFRFTFSDGAKVVFAGRVATTLIPTGSAQDNVLSPVQITMSGTPTYYTS